MLTKHSNRHVALPVNHLLSNFIDSLAPVLEWGTLYHEIFMFVLSKGCQMMMPQINCSQEEEEEEEEEKEERRGRKKKKEQ